MVLHEAVGLRLLTFLTSFNRILYLDYKLCVKFNEILQTTFELFRVEVEVPSREFR